MPFFSEPAKLSAFEAKFEAQKIAFAPVSFQVTRCLLQFDILKHIDAAGDEGISLEILKEQTGLTEYALGVLLDMALSMGLVWHKGDNYILDKTGWFLLHDDMAATNLNFIHDICYQGLFHLQQALEQGSPEGLKVFGDWPTIYPALSQLPTEAKHSWFAFDHYYSDHAFDSLMPRIFAKGPTHLVDIGGNTGKWALKCAGYNTQCRVTIMDLAPQLELAAEAAKAAGLSGRISGLACDLLAPDGPFVTDGDLYWMSQFLDCFSEAQILAILQACAKAMPATAELCILETFWDRQPNAASAYCVNATSLYFTAMANGNSRMYHSKVLLKLLQQAGFYVDEDIDDIGLGHTLLRCKLK
ncbi:MULTISPECIES: methyltransferase [Shewanella]|uniref:methyltransferase n=1 Tax=Shewanella TaxID=22 RepID=UPI00237A8433|nr:methyltransferase [Shewanella sp. K8]MDE0565402.1 methyltransferase [Shewanella sp. K8]